MTTPPTTSGEAESTRPVASLPFARRRTHGVTCVVETCIHMRLTGWAIVQPWQPCAIELRQGSRRLPVQAQRLHRADVLAHLGADPRMELSLGFTLELPPELWQECAPDGSTQFHLCVDGVDADMPSFRLTVEHLEEWQQALAWTRDPGPVPAEWERLRQHLQHHLSPEQLQAAGTQISLNCASLSAPETLQKPPLRWAVEDVSDLRIAGWAVLLRGGEERFEVMCNGQLLPAGAVRYERSDVQQAIGAVKLESGFEVSIPSSIWRHAAAGRTAYVQLLIAGQPVLEQVVALSKGRLEAMVSRWLSAGKPLSDTAAENRYLTLLLIDHVRASGLLPDLPAENLKFLCDAAAAEGVNLTVPLSARVDPRHLSVARELWRLQRALNSHLSSGTTTAEMLEAALDQTLAELQDQVSPAAVDRFLVSMIPPFCSQDALPRLRLRLPQHELDTLASSQGRWELSMLVPVTVMDELASGEGRLVATGNLLEQLCCTPDRGWVETAALLDAWRRLARSPRALAMDDADLQRILQWSLKFFESMGHGPASRIHDENLIDGMYEVMALAVRLGQDARLAAIEAALHHYGLCPRFWGQGLAERSAGPQDEAPFVLRDAHARFERLLATLPGLQSGDTSALDACSLALAGMRELGCAEIDNFHRHALLAHAGSHAPLPAQSLQLLQGLHAHEALRWLGLAPEGAGAAPWPQDELARLLLTAAPAAPVAHVELRRTLLSPTQDALAAAIALCGESHGFIGLLWLARRAHLGSDEAALALGPALLRAMSVCERHHTRYPHPPAALCNALAWACRPAEPAPARWQLDAELSNALATRARELWPLLDATEPLPSAPVVTVTAPGVGSLVIAKSRAPHADEAAAGIARTWGSDLVQAGIPWMLWHVQQGPVGFTDSGPDGARGRVHAPTLLALLSWLVEHSDFGHVLLVDEDVVLQVQAWRGLSGGPAHHYHGAALTTPLAAPTGTLDKSPQGTRFASTEHGLALSRFAAERVLQLRTTARGARLARDSFDEEKYLADLLCLDGLALSEEGHVVHPRRVPRPDLHAFGYLSFYPPSTDTPTVLTHLAHGGLAAQAPGSSSARLAPRRLWPTDRPPRHDNHGQALALVELSDPAKADALRETPCIVVAAARNERLLLPHFLAHYRQLGVKHFVIVDNLSTDGSREFLLDQPDVVVYSADSPYSLSRYGVAWQQTVLAAHAQGQWALVADIDEFLVWPGCEEESLPMLCHRLSGAGAQAARVLMVDMYPEGALQEADFTQTAPFAAANCFDAAAAMPWRLGSGSFSNSPTWVSGLRHRLLPDSAPNHYTSQKVALLQHRPWVHCSEGLHYAAGLTVATELLAFAHFKFHAGFHAKVLEEVQRAEHYNAAEEYKQYQALLNATSGSFFDPLHSRRYTGSQSFVELLT